MGRGKWWLAVRRQRLDPGATLRQSMSRAADPAAGNVAARVWLRFAAAHPRCCHALALALSLQTSVQWMRRRLFNP